MKKIVLVLLLIIVCTFALVACGKKPVDNDQNTTPNGNDSYESGELEDDFDTTPKTSNFEYTFVDNNLCIQSINNTL